MFKLWQNYQQKPSPLLFLLHTLGFMLHAFASPAIPWQASQQAFNIANRFQNKPLTLGCKP